MIEERDNKLNEIEQLADIQDSEMIDALAHEAETATKTIKSSGGSSLQSSSISSVSISQSTATSQSVNQPKKAVQQPEYNPDYDLEKLQEEKEAEIKGYVETLERANFEIDNLKNTLDIDSSKKRVIEEDKKEMAENLKTL